MERFGGHYDTWTDNRIRWILDNFGERAFEGKTVLDIGGGTGHIARRVRELGARQVEVDRLLACVPNALGRKVLDPALNADFHRYDWENTLEGNVEDGLRRFWAVRRLSQLDAVGERAAAEALLREIHYSKTLETLV